MERIKHSILGEYEQIVSEDIGEVGHKKLASEGKYGWQMPVDTATMHILSQCSGKYLMDLGCGWGEIISLPALTIGAQQVFAVDITPEHLADSSPLLSGAAAMGKSDKIHSILIQKNWWYSSLQKNPTTASLLQIEQDSPEDGTLDIIFARHSIQFGSPQGVLRVFDLASTALKEGGIFCAINFTPFTHYAFAYDEGVTMRKIMEINEQFSRGKVLVPGGYLNGVYGPTGLKLGQLVGRSDLANDKESTFLYFDNPTLVGLLELWKKTREIRGLEPDLVLTEDFYFTPDRITAFNKLTLGDPQFHNKENYLFVLQKQGS